MSFILVSPSRCVKNGVKIKLPFIDWSFIYLQNKEISTHNSPTREIF